MEVILAALITAMGAVIAAQIFYGRKMGQVLSEVEKEEGRHNNTVDKMADLSEKHGDLQTNLTKEHNDIKEKLSDEHNDIKECVSSTASNINMQLVKIDTTSADMSGKIGKLHDLALQEQALQQVGRENYTQNQQEMMKALSTLSDLGKELELLSAENARLKERVSQLVAKEAVLQAQLAEGQVNSRVDSLSQQTRLNELSQQIELLKEANWKLTVENDVLKKDNKRIMKAYQQLSQTDKMVNPFDERSKDEQQHHERDYEREDEWER